MSRNVGVSAISSCLEGLGGCKGATDFNERRGGAVGGVCYTNFG